MSSKPSYNELRQRVDELEQAKGEWLRTKEALEKSRSRFYQMLDSFPYGIYIVDRECNIEYVNEVLRREFGDPGTRKCHAYFHDLQAPCPWCRNDKVMRGETLRWYWHCPKNERQYELIDIPLYDEDGSISKLEVFHDITEQKRIETALRQSEAKYKALFDSATEGILVAELESKRLRFANPAMCSMLGYSEQELCTMHVMDIHPRDSLDHVLAEFEAQARGDKVTTLDIPCLRKDGSVIYADISTGSLEIDGITCNLGLFTDVTERKQAEEELRRSEHWFRKIFENAVTGIAIADWDGTFLHCNPAYCRIVGYSEEELRGMNLASLQHPDDLQRNTDHIDRLKKGELSSYVIENRYVHKLGQAVWVRKTVFCLEGKAGEPGHPTALVTDITDQVRSERIKAAEIRIIEQSAQRRLPDLLQSIIDEAEALTESAIGFYHFVDEDDTTIHLQAWSSNTINAPCRPVVEESHYSVDKAGIWADCIRERRPVIYNDYQGLEHKKGVPEHHPVLDRILLIPIIRANRVVAVLGLGNKKGDYDERDVDIVEPLAGRTWDIVDSKLSAEALERNRERYRLLVENANDAIFVTANEDGKILFVNKRTEDLTGYREEELFRKTFFNFVHPDDRGEVPLGPSHEVVEPGTVEPCSFRLINKDGETLSVQLTCVSLDWEGLPATLNFLRDITRQKKLEAQLQHAQKMESIGTLAGGIAHDFNNILSSVLGYTELALSEVEEGNTLREDLEEVLKAGNRAKRLTQQILTISRHQDRTKKPLELNPLIKEALKMLRSTIPASITIQQEICSKPLVVCADATQIHQVVVNLVTNAMQAMVESEGTIDVALEPVMVTQAVATIFPEMNEGDYALLRVSDTGSGIESEYLEKVFEPYFTTKEKGEGTGLGLSVVHGIIQAHDGQITVSSVPGEGTSFSVYLPLAKGKRAEGENRDKEEVAGGDEHILLIDDDQAIVKMHERNLSRLGYKVSAISDSMEALELFRRTPEDFDLVISDMAMPQIAGDKLCEKIREIKADIPVILNTGFSEKLKSVEKRLRINAVLMKPVSLNQMAGKVREILDACHDANEDPAHRFPGQS